MARRSPWPSEIDTVCSNPEIFFVRLRTLRAFVVNVRRPPRYFIHNPVDAPLGILIQNKDLLELSTGAAQQFEAILLRTGQCPLMRKDNFVRVILELANTDKSLPGTNLDFARY